MDAQTLRLRNNFILLKNGGKDFDTIVKEMEGVSIKNLKAWEKSYNEEYKKVQEINKPKDKEKLLLGNATDQIVITPNTSSSNLSTVRIIGINKDKEYTYSNKINFNLPFKDSMLLKLWQYSNLKVDVNNAHLKNHLYRESIEQAKVAYKLLAEQLIEINIEKIESKSNYYYKYKTIIKDKIKEEKIKEAVDFFLNKIYHPENIKNIKKEEVNYSDYGYLNAKNILPIAIKKVKFCCYQDIKETFVSKLNVDSQWIFVTGENGFGKTSFLQALTIGLFGTKDQNNDLLYNSKDANIIVEYKNGNESFINQTISNEITSLKNLACYGPTRLNIQSGFTKEDEVKALSVTQCLFSAQSTLLNIENRLIIWKLSNDKKFDYVVRIFKKLIPYLADVTLSNDKTKIIYTEKETSTRKKYNQVEFLQLASGFRSLIGLVGDMIIRFYLNQPEVENPSDFTGIVIIDEFDLHLHPKLQMELPSKLSEIFPLVQFIVSTHSAIPLLGAPKNSTIIKVSRNKSDGITAEVLDIDLTKLTPNIILTSPIFDMDTITSKSKESMQEVRTEDDYDAMQKSDKIDKLLQEKEQQGKKYPDSLFV